MRTSLVLVLAAVTALTGLTGCGASVVSPSHGNHARAAVRPTFDDLDVDHDAKVSNDELMRASVLYVDDFDANQDGRLTDPELADGLFHAWDLDTSGLIEEGELLRAIVAWLPVGADDHFDAWDTDGSSDVDRAELRRGLDRVGAFRTYDDDGNGAVTDLELNDTLFLAWDIDGDQSIDALEWRWD